MPLSLYLIFIHAIAQVKRIKISANKNKEFIQQYKINRRPRLTLDFEEPKNLFH